MKRFILAEYYDNDLNAGSKATNDVLNILSKNGYEKILIDEKLIFKYSKKYKNWDKPQNLFQRLHCKFKMFKLTVHSFFTLKKLKDKFVCESEVFIQYPFIQLKMRPELQKKIFYKIIKTKHIHLTVLVHDLNGLRLNNVRIENRDIDFFKLAEKVIVHNEKMKKYLISKGVEGRKIVFINFFDYLHTNSIPIIHTKNEPIVFAGNLNRFKFLYKLKNLPTNIILNLYGKLDFCIDFPENIHYCKCLNSDIIPSELKGGWGLVWEGDSISTCNGFQGEYLKFNSSHKNSLYIVSRIPIIIWSKAAMASFIIQKNIGITIENLEEIPEKINLVTNEQYNIMQKNIEIIAKDLENGKSILSVL